MNRFFSGAATVVIAMCAARGASAQSAAAWPSVGASFVRVQESQAPAMPLAAPSVAGPAVPNIANTACATRMRDTKTGREYLLQSSTVEQRADEHESGATTTTTTRLTRGIGEYARMETPTSTSKRLVKIDCLTSKVIASGGAAARK